MKTVKEIDAEILALNNEKKAITSKIVELKEERVIVLRENFEAKYNLKKGDCIQLKGGRGTFYYDHYEEVCGLGRVLCRRMTHEGVPSQNRKLLYLADIEGFTKIGHVELSAVKTDIPNDERFNKNK